MDEPTPERTRVMAGTPADFYQALQDTADLTQDALRIARTNESPAKAQVFATLAVAMATRSQAIATYLGVEQLSELVNLR